MSEPTARSPYSIYVKTWVLLLFITVAMLASESFHMPRIFLIIYLLGFMAVKAAMIGGNFMHLRHEKANLVAIVVLGIVVTSLIFVLFTTPEAHSIVAKSLP
jgi:cytochrome c oxidase subunit IV